MSAPKLDFEHVLKAHQILRADGEPFEVRYKNARGASSEWPGSIDALRKLLEKLDRPEIEGIWWSFQPLGAETNGATKDAAIRLRRWLFLDMDRAVKSNSPASFEELAALRSVFDSALAFLAGHNIVPRLFGNSGNGWHAYFRLVDWPNDEEHKTLVKSFLEMMAAKFNSPVAEVDTSVFNAGRVTKILGTVSRKGVATTDRPHRPTGVEGLHRVSLAGELIVAVQQRARSWKRGHPS